MVWITRAVLASSIRGVVLVVLAEQEAEVGRERQAESILGDYRRKDTR
jgi:hypothetical protein